MKFHVWVDMYTDNGTRLGGCRVTVDSPTREEAPQDAIKTMIRTAKTYNARYHGQMPSWMQRSENFDDYAVTKVRKAPAKRATAEQQRG